jgi:hypothetical protein
MAERDEHGRWLPGASPNPVGRPQGARGRFSDAFFRDIAEAWAQQGASVLQRVATTDPSTFLRVCGSLIPREVALSMTQSVGGLDPDDMPLLLELLKAAKAALPDAGDRKPGDVFQLMVDALRVHAAPLVSSSANGAAI